MRYAFASTIMALLIFHTSILFAFTPAQEEQILKDIAEIKATLRLHMEQTNKRFEDMNKRFDMLVHLIDKRFEDMNKRFEDMNKRFEDINTILIIYGTLLAAIFGVLFVGRKKSASPDAEIQFNKIMQRFDELERQRKQEIDAYIEQYVKQLVTQAVKKELSSTVNS
jgi:DnaJ-domain-containing protein 1